jgi:hypothetical protein
MAYEPAERYSSTGRIARAHQLRAVRADRGRRRVTMGVTDQIIAGAMHIMKVVE